MRSLELSNIKRELEPEYVKQAMNLFHVTEFLILVEYTEVIIPMVCSESCLCPCHLLFAHLGR